MFKLSLIFEENFYIDAPKYNISTGAPEN